MKNLFYLTWRARLFFMHNGTRIKTAKGFRAQLLLWWEIFLCSTRKQQRNRQSFSTIFAFYCGLAHFAYILLYLHEASRFINENQVSTIM
jgi:hypothetical protein